MEPTFCNLAAAPSQDLSCLLPAKSFLFPITWKQDLVGRVDRDVSCRHILRGYSRNCAAEDNVVTRLRGPRRGFVMNLCRESIIAADIALATHNIPLLLPARGSNWLS